MKDPDLNDPVVSAAVERAKFLGTYKKIDRSVQYEGPERARPEALLHAVQRDTCGPVTGQIQRLGDKFPGLPNREFRNTLQGRFLRRTGKFITAERPRRIVRQVFSIHGIRRR